MKNKSITLPAATSDGVFLAHYSEQGLAELDWPKSGRASARAVNTKQIPLPILRWHRATTDALNKILTGRDAKNLPPLDWTGKTEFQQSVWRQLLKISAGKTKSYGEIAAADFLRRVRQE